MRIAFLIEKEMDFPYSVDLMFILDSSSSIGGRDWWRIKQRILDFARALQNFKNVKASLISYSDGVVKHFEGPGKQIKLFY